MRTIPFVTVDVFTSQQFAGNPLAVITDARELREDEMQRIAAEFNFSETTFVLPPVDPGNTAQVRIFDPVCELPFAGHPNVGTGYVLAQAGTVFDQVAGNRLRFEELAGIVDVEILHEGTNITGSRIWAPRQLEIGTPLDVAIVANCAGVSPSATVTANHPPLIASVGLPFAIVELDSLETLASAKGSPEAFAAAVARLHTLSGRFPLMMYVCKGRDPFRLQARMFDPLGNIAEDPATGSASAALGALLVSLQPQQDMETTIRIDQGVEMGRPSQIDVHVRKQGGQVVNVSVGGACTVVTRGVIERPDRDSSGPGHS